MKKHQNWLTYLLFIFFLNLITAQESQFKSDFVIAFGSCNNQHLKNDLWKEIQKNQPDIFIWGGDIIYSDTHKAEFLEKNYNIQKYLPEYQNFISEVTTIGTWDDHDYGSNDGGAEYEMKQVSQQLFLDFFDVPKTDERRNRDGIYFSKLMKVNQHSVKLIILDTRYFRSSLTKDHSSKKRYKPSVDKKGTMLGETQWNWLQSELNNSEADFNIIMSSIQFLSKEHGFETWGNMPNEVKKLEQMIVKSNAKRVIILSGDRHIAEISAKQIKGLDYPLIDFTSSGLTHAYTSFKGEPNEYRISEVVPKVNFGILKFNFSNNQVIMEIRGEQNQLHQTVNQNY